MKRLILFSVPVLCAFKLYAHSGRTDSSGCHKNRKIGTYHCHGNKPLIRSSIGNKHTKKPRKSNQDLTYESKQKTLETSPQYVATSSGKIWYIFHPNKGTGIITRLHKIPRIPKGYIVFSQKQLSLYDLLQKEVWKSEYSAMDDNQMMIAISKKWNSSPKKLNKVFFNGAILTNLLSDSKLIDRRTRIKKVSEKAVEAIVVNLGYSRPNVKLTYQIAGKFVHTNLITIIVPLKKHPSSAAIKLARTAAHRIRSAIKKQKYSDVGEIMFRFINTTEEKETHILKTVTNLKAEGFYSEM